MNPFLPSAMPTSSSSEETENIIDMEIAEEIPEKKEAHGQIISNSSARPSLALIPVLLLMMQHLKTESDFFKKENNRLNQENEALNEELERSYKEIGRLKNCLHFPLLSLPDEIIGHILSFLPIKDRMIARICKKMDEIESDYKYYVPRLLIDERATDDPHRFNNSYITDHKQYFVLFKERIYSIDFFKRIISNAKFGYLAINITTTKNFHREIFNLIKYCNVHELFLRFWEHSMEMEMMVDSYLFDLIGTCSKLKLDRNAGITAAGLHKVYTGIMDGSSKLRSLNLGSTNFEFNRNFLRLIGIGFANGDLYSSRNIEAFETTEIIILDEDDESDEEDEIGEIIYIHKHVFDGQLEILFPSDHNVPFDEDVGTMKLEWHETKEDLEMAKKTEGFVKVEVYPE